MDYTRNDLIEAYRKLGVKRGGTVLVQSDLASLGVYEHHEANKICEAHFTAIADLLDLSAGTLIVPTGSMSLCNTSIPFDIENTPSEMGILTEHIRRKDGAVRSFHPFDSYTALGKNAMKVCANTSRHSHGPETPEARAIELDAIDISIGLHPRFTCSTVHHIEHVMAVPYRYTKEFIHPVINGGEVKHERYYMCVWYRECDLKRNYNFKIFQVFEQRYILNSVKVGRGAIYSYLTTDFYKCAVELFRDDIYIWLDEEPENKPYTK